MSWQRALETWRFSGRGLLCQSHLSDGRVISWPQAWLTQAIDAEIASAEVPDALARRTSVDDPGEFWPRWTVLQVTCKLLDVPAQMWLSYCGLTGDPWVETYTFTRGDLVVTVGARAAERQRAVR